MTLVSYALLRNKLRCFLASDYERDINFTGLHEAGGGPGNISGHRDVQQSLKIVMTDRQFKNRTCLVYRIDSIDL